MLDEPIKKGENVKCGRPGVGLVMWNGKLLRTKFLSLCKVGIVEPVWSRSLAELYTLSISPRNLGFSNVDYPINASKS